MRLNSRSYHLLYISRKRPICWKSGEVLSAKIVDFPTDLTSARPFGPFPRQVGHTNPSNQIIYPKMEWVYLLLGTIMATADLPPDLPDGFDMGKSISGVS